ncbi:unnamed protein product [Schistosoma mattheei]|uniref:Uncharacterized protein n=1 Tax=Schistosoma mattheei TaxID=31246 RepID=A0A183NHP3_9TREM|nr:unnamed protein product [Schistosoma mattheei]
MVVGGSQQETLHPCFVLFGTRQQGAPVILRELVLLNLFDPVSPNYTVRDSPVGLNLPVVNIKHSIAICASLVEFLWPVDLTPFRSYECWLPPILVYNYRLKSH